MKRLRTIAVSSLALMMVSSATADAASGGDAEPDSVKRTLEPRRLEHRSSLSLTGSVFVLGSDAVPLLGVQLAVNLTPRLALEGELSSIGIFHRLDAGVRGYLLTGLLSPYLFGRAGAMIVSFEDIGASLALDTGVGLELSTRSRFNAFIEVGAVGLPIEGAGMPRVTAGIGARF